MGLKSEIRISKYETISKSEYQMIKTFSALIHYLHDLDMFWILNFGHSYLFRISCLGFRIYKKLIKQIITKLQQVTSVNDLALASL